MVRKAKEKTSAAPTAAETGAVAVAAAPKTPPQLAHELAMFVHQRGCQLSKGLIDDGELGQGAAIAVATEELVSAIKQAFPYA